MKRVLWAKLLEVLAALPITVLLTACSVRVITSRTLVSWEYSRPGFPADPYGLSAAERSRLAGLCIDYLVTGADISLLGEARLSDGRVAFGARELDHMVDVQMVYRALMTAGWVAGAVSLAALAILAARPASRCRAGRALLGGGLFTVCLLLAFGLLMLLGWSFFFDSFHRTLFEDGTWTFYWSDTLIRLFPLRFWQDVAAAVLGLVALGAAMLVIAGSFWRRRTPIASTAASTAGPRC